MLRGLQDVAGLMFCMEEGTNRGGGEEVGLGHHHGS